MNYLLIFHGPAVRVGIIYLMSGLGGSSLSSLMIGSDISVGASGALFGVLGAMLSELITNWTIYSNRVRCEHVSFKFLIIFYYCKYPKSRSLFGRSLLY